METRGLLPAALACCLLFASPGVASAHEVQPAVPAVTGEQVGALLGDEESDAMTTGSISKAPVSSCEQGSKALKMPFSNAGHPDELP